MARSLDELEQEVRSLRTEERNQLLRDLIADIDGKSDEDIQQAWLQEAKRRHKELHEGLAEPVQAKEVLRKARSRLKNED